MTITAQLKKRNGSADRIQTKLCSVARSNSADERLGLRDGSYNYILLRFFCLKFLIFNTVLDTGDSSLWNEKKEELLCNPYFKWEQ